MGKWLDLAREMAAPCDNSDITDNSPPNVTNVTNVMGQTPTGERAKELCAILDGVDRLKAMTLPRGMPPTVWRTYVADARFLAHHGVAAAALGKGWTALDLFGISTDEQWQCLASWIGGRRDEYGQACLLLTEIRGDRSLPYAVHVRDGRHSWHYRQPAPADAVLPWTM